MIIKFHDKIVHFNLSFFANNYLAERISGKTLSNSVLLHIDNNGNAIVGQYY